MLRATTGEPVPLQVLLPDGQTSLYVRARVYGATGSVLQTLTLAHKDDGLYMAAWTPDVDGYYTVVYDVFTDQAFTASAGYEKGGEQVDVSSDRLNVLRLLGLQHENSVVDQQTYTGTGRLLSARIRSYDSSAAATAAGTAGLLFSWVLQAGYNANDQLISYKILRGS